MGHTHSPYILQLFMGPSYFWRGLTPLTLPYFTQCFRTDISDPYWGREGQRVAGQSRPVGIRRQATRCTCLTRCWYSVFLKIHAVLSLRHQETGTDVEVAARLHKVSTPAIARGVSFQAGKSSSRRSRVSRHLFGRYSRLCHHNRRRWAPWGSSCQPARLSSLQRYSCWRSGVIWQYFEWVGGT